MKEKNWLSLRSQNYARRDLSPGHRKIYISHDFRWKFLPLPRHLEITHAHHWENVRWQRRYRGTDLQRTKARPICSASRTNPNWEDHRPTQKLLSRGTWRLRKEVPNEVNQNTQPERRAEVCRLSGKGKLSYLNFNFERNYLEFKLFWIFVNSPKII